MSCLCAVITGVICGHLLAVFRHLLGEFTLRFIILIILVNYGFKYSFSVIVTELAVTSF